jgi:hypothetical protein
MPLTLALTSDHTQARCYFPALIAQGGKILLVLRDWEACSKT